MASKLSTIGLGLIARGSGHVMAMSACVGKLRYASAHQAVKAASIQSRRKKVALGHYHCGRCGNYHIGGNPLTQRNANARPNADIAQQEQDQH